MKLSLHLLIKFKCREYFKIYIHNPEKPMMFKMVAGDRNSLVTSACTMVKNKMRTVFY
jgi:hypothetical protein